MSNLTEDMKDSYVDESKKQDKELDQPDEIPGSEEYMEGGALHLERLADAFMASAKRWEMIVYPSLFAFIILAGYGFFLIYSLTKDAHLIATEMSTISVKMDSISQNMTIMTQTMDMMDQTMDTQSRAMNEMVISMRGMNMSINQMRHDMSIMNQSVSRPMSFMNSFMPW